MKHSLLLGGILVAVVLFLMLGSVRTACISLIAIPLSLLSAVIVLQRLGITLNTITLGGLAIALGEVVDDSIIDVENIYRRLREYLARKKSGEVPPPGAPLSPALSLGQGEKVPPMGRVPEGVQEPSQSLPPPPAEEGRREGETGGNVIQESAHVSKLQEIFDVVLHASLEVRSSVVYATFIVALVFLPVLTLTGLQGSFFAPLALSYILAIMASLLVALTVTPALAFLLFGGNVGRTEDARIQRWLKARYARTLAFVARWPRIIITVVVILCMVTALRLPLFGGNLLPDFRESHFVLQVFTTAGTSLQETLRIGTLISHALLNDKHVNTVEQQVGRAELGEDPWGPNRSEFHVELKRLSGEEEAKMADELRDILKQFPGINFEVTTFLGDRIGETLTGEVEPVVVNVFGDDLDVLDAKAQEIANVLNGVPGHADVKVKAPPGSPRLAIRLRPDRLSQFGFHPVEVLDGIQTAYQGTIVAQTHRGNQTIDVAVILDPAERRDPEGIGSLLLNNSQGTRLPLQELADVYPTTGRPSILHEGARRRQTVTCATSGRDITSFVDDAKKQVAAKLTFPAGTYAVFSGAAQAKAQAQRELLVHSGIGAVGILLLLWMAFRHWRNLMLVLVNVPFALVGGILALWVTSHIKPDQAALTIGSLVGFVTLFGITTRNSIMLISHFEHLVKLEGMTWGSEAAIRGASERLMPILMTATVTGLGLLPLALGAGEAGREIEGPMAIVILGGLITSTALNLLVLPTLALRFGRFEKALE